MPLYLDVPYGKKDLAKGLGAKWNRDRKQWYVENKYDYYKFLDWIPYVSGVAEVICDHIYIVETNRKCYKCKKETNVISFAFQNYFSIYKDKFGNLQHYEYHDSNICFVTIEKKLCNMQLELFLKRQFRFYYSYSRAIREFYCANHCIHCGVIQGNNYLHEEIGSPFFIFDENEPKDFKLYKIRLSEDGVTAALFTSSSFRPEKDKAVKVIEDFKIKPVDL